MKKKFRLVLFDLGRVLVDFRQEAIAERLMEKAGKNYADILAYYQKTNVFHDFECGKLTPEETLQNINTMLGTQLAMEEFRTLWSDIFFDNKGMEEIVDALYGKYKLSIISDTNVLHYEHIVARFPIVKKFDAHILSYEVGVRKPDRRMYETALQQAGAAAGEAIFIDDKEKNVEGARALGITGVHYRSVTQTKKDFRALGLLP